jgi:alpha-ketoglutarate-dependent taurine dioxygenase
MLSAKRLEAPVGARVVGADRTVLLKDAAAADWCLQALEENGVLVFPGLFIDDETQVAFSRRLGSVESVGSGEHPEIFRVTLDPKKNRAAA